MSRIADAVELLSLGVTPQSGLVRVGGGMKAVQYGHEWELVVDRQMREIFANV